MHSEIRNIALVFILCTQFICCQKEDYRNVYDPLIPPYTFPDTCDADFFSRLLDIKPPERIFPSYLGGYYITDIGFVKKTDYAGVKIWDTPVSYLYSLTESQNGSLFILGGAPVELIKTDAQGNILWKKPEKYGTIAPSADGGCLIYYRVFSSLGSNTVAVKYSSIGVKEWTYIFEGDELPAPNALELSNGHWVFIFYGESDKKHYWRQTIDKNGFFYSESVMYNEKFLPVKDLSLMPGNSILVMTNPSGKINLSLLDSSSVLWIKEYDFSSSIPSQLSVTSSGEIFITGKILRESGDFSNYDLQLVKTDNTGNLLFEKQFGSEANEAGLEIIQEISGAISITGMADGFDGSSRKLVSKFYLLRTDENGNTCY